MIIIIIVIIIIMIFGRKLGIGGAFFFPAPPNFPDHALIFSRVFHLRVMAAEIWVRDYVIPTILACVVVRRLEIIGAGKNGACLPRAPRSFWRPLLPIACYTGYYFLKVMSHETILNDDVAMLEQCCNYSKQRRNNVVVLCGAKNRRC